MQSDSIGKLAEALAKAQGAMTSAKMDGANPAFKRAGKDSKYATLANLWDAARKPLADNNLAVSQVTDILDTGAIVLITRLMHSSGEWIGSVYPVVSEKASPQAMGSAMTYARRYTLGAILGLAADDDDDGNEASGVQVQHQHQEQHGTTNGHTDNGNGPTDKQLKALFALGVKLYTKEAWENGKRAELVRAVTKGRTDSAGSLTKDEISVLLDGLKKKEAQYDAELAAVPEQDPEGVFA